MYEDNDGKFPDESPVEVRYPRSKQEEQAVGTVEIAMQLVRRARGHGQPRPCQPCQRCLAMWTRRFARPTRHRSGPGSR